MAERVQVLLTCDLHGDDTPGENRVDFALDGTSYGIDLCADHARQLHDDFAPYVGSARRGAAAGRSGAGRRSGRGRGGGGGAGRRRTAEIREWARNAGLTISERGRIPATIMEQYEAANS